MDEQLKLVRQKPMNGRVKRLWQSELRSGKYLQGQCALKQISTGGTTYCCLGVLAEIYARETGEAWILDGSSNQFRMDGSAGDLGGNILSWSGLESGRGPILDGEDATIRNDVSEWTFDEIADALDRVPDDGTGNESK